MSRHYTNISKYPVGWIEGPDGQYPIRPCMKSGFCCTKAPCGFGEWNDDKSSCKYLLPKNDIGQRDCGRYEWIKENVEGYEYYPGFGAGCCMPIGNTIREEIIENIDKKFIKVNEHELVEFARELKQAIDFSDLFGDRERFHPDGLDLVTTEEWLDMIDNRAGVVPFEEKIFERI